MPTYGFVCNYCGNRFEIFATISQKEKGLDLYCENCGSHDVRRVMSAFMTFSSGSSKGGERGGCGPSAGSGCCG